MPELVFAFVGDELLARRAEGGLLLPDETFLRELGGVTGEAEPFAEHDGLRCRWMRVSSERAESLADDWEPFGLRSVYGQVSDSLFMLAGKAFQLMTWDSTTRFCGRCGNPTRASETERVKECPTCGHHMYPLISPAIIVAVVRDGRILLARSARFKRGFFSVIAGFVEPGETLEETVAREVREETSLEVDGIRYFGSQPWPFPHSLMVGFTAEYAGGDILVDGEEIAEADWYKSDELPEIPGPISISRRLIDWFVNEYPAD